MSSPATLNTPLWLDTLPPLFTLDSTSTSSEMAVETNPMEDGPVS